MRTEYRVYSAGRYLYGTFDTLEKAKAHLTKIEEKISDDLYIEKRTKGIVFVTEEDYRPEVSI